MSKLKGGMGFRDMEDFNIALLAKQIWRLIHAKHSLAFKILKARYLPHCAILEAGLGNRPSYIWRSLHSAQWVIDKGARWLEGNGFTLNIGEAKWIPRPNSFKLIAPKKNEFYLI